MTRQESTSPEFHIYAGNYSETFFMLLEKAWKRDVILGLVPSSGLWRQKVDLLGLSQIQIHEGKLNSRKIEEKSQFLGNLPHVTGKACLVFTTSGSTQGFKWVVLSREGIEHVLRSLANILSLSSKDCLAITPPAFHCFGAVVGVLLARYVGCRFSVLPNYDVKVWKEKMKEDRCTHILGVPTVFEDLLSSNFRPLPSLRGGIIAGAPVKKETFDRAKIGLGLPELTIGYGLTEASPAVCHTRVGDPVLFDFQIGSPLPDTVVSLRADYEGWVFGPQTALATISDQGIHSSEWVRTGDVLEQRNGLWIFKGRTTDILNQGGEKLSLLQVDQILQTHFPDSSFLSFIAPDERLGERLGIAVKGSYPDDSQIRKVIYQTFGSFFSSCVVHRVLEFPRLPSGKITRNSEAITYPAKGAYNVRSK